MKYVQIVFNEFFKKFVRNLFKSKLFYYVVFLLALCVCAEKCFAQSYEYRGVFPAQNVLLSYCENCFLQLPPEYLQTNLVLSVSTDNKNELFTAIQKSSLASGWKLRKSGKNLIATPEDVQQTTPFISCLDNKVKDVPKHLFSLSVKSDSIECAKRDSLRLVLLDSLNKVKDSLSKIKPLDFKKYELRYYSVSKGFTDKLGVKWQDVIFSGNLHNKLNVYDNWELIATQNNDTTFNSRKMFFSLDSAINIDWGSEEQVIEKSFVQDGVITESYEWRKYGILVNVQRGNGRVKINYVFRDKDNSVSVLSGSAVGVENDTLHLWGEYSVNREIILGLPFLSGVPILGYLFSTHTTQTDYKKFELFLLPTHTTPTQTQSTQQYTPDNGQPHNADTPATTHTPTTQPPTQTPESKEKPAP